MKIGIYGGTFNPPHLGHMEAARTAVRVLGLDKLLLIPAATPPHKALPEETPEAAHRLAMTERMADSLALPGVAEVSQLELERGGTSYTCDTLQAIHDQYPDAELWLLLGSDMFLSLHTWHDPAAITALAQICAFGRTRQDGEECFAPQRAFLSQQFHARITTIALPGLVEVSSTQMRRLLARGEGRSYLLPSVYGYILLNGLYGTHEDLHQLALPELRACSYSMVKAKRVPHIRGTEEEAVRLARRWGADASFAQRAGILHDCTKYLDAEEQLLLCQQYGVALDPLELQSAKLLHSKTGACIAGAVFGEPDEVCQAIFWHTTAKDDMTALEKILYLADYIEPNRDFSGVEQLRQLAYTDLDRALLFGIAMTIQEMTDRGLPVHPNTLRARDWLLAHETKTED